MQRGRPWVRMKIAASLDGGTALFNGVSQWITSEPARADGHHELVQPTGLQRRRLHRK
jgi:diaminohydroxyphosphoribosylaminopyrimidine deaminase/5-amino-6-(5-phosphoribosylamino)uracil reductase